MRKRQFFATITLCALLVAGLILYMLTLKEGDDSAGQVFPVVINEVMTSNKGSVSDGMGNFPDWVEFYNPTDKPVDMGGYGLSDSLLEGAKYVFPSGAVVEPDGYLVVYCAGEALSDYHADFKLNDTEELTLLDQRGQVVTSLQLQAVESGMSLARDSADKWQQMRPSPGYPNTDAGVAAYEAAMQETQDIGVYINEFMASNATTLRGADGTYPDWIELYNSTGQDVDLSGYGVSDNLSQPMKYQLPEGTTIPAGGYLLILCSGNQGLIDGELHAPFSLRAYEEDVVFSDPNGKILDSYSYTRQEEDVSMARTPDGTGAFGACSQPSPGFANTSDGYNAAMAAYRLPLGDVYISEMLGNNQSTAKAADGEYYDWIELYNQSGQAVDLSGYGLSDNPGNPAKWVFPEGITLESGEYLVVYASGLNQAEGQKKNDLHLNFNLSAQGDRVFLFDPAGNLVDKLSAGAFLGDVSYGRNGSDERFYYTQPTPGGENGQGQAGITSQPVFETLPGIFDGPVAVSLRAGEGETIHYTTDCTTPTADSPAYTGPIQVSENTVIRAVALRDGYLTGYSNTGTFLFTTDGVDHSLPVATLVTDPDNLWDSKTGIYATGDQFDPDAASYTDVLSSATYYQSKFDTEEEVDEIWTKPAAFSLMEEGQQVFSQNVDIRIAGSYGRGRAQKGFNIIARGKYGNSRMEYPFFNNRDFTEYKSLTLRAGAQDQNRSKIRDELATGLLEGTDINVLYQAYRPVVLYLNGEYWGVYFLKEKRNRFFVAQHEGVADVDNMLIGKASTLVSYGTNEEWVALMNYVKSHDLSDPTAYAYVCERVDVNSFMDYMIAEIYNGNTDTPNIQYYKLPDGKWKWIFYDFCWGFGSPTHESLSFRRGAKPAGSDLFNALLKNSEWKDAFIRRFAQLLNTAFAPERVLGLIEELYGYVEPEIAREREKFNQSTFMGEQQPAENLGSYDSFQREIESLKTFAKERPAALRSQIQKEFGLSDSYMQEVFGQ